MTRRSFSRVLLSLLLLMSQQMAISHAMTHWAGSRGNAAQPHKAAGQQDERGVAAAFAQDQTCEQCLAFAQIASAVGSASRCFAADGSATCATGPSATQPGCARAICVFHSRAALAVALLNPLSASAADDKDLAAIRAQIREMKESYEARLQALEQRLQDAQAQNAAQPAPSRRSRLPRPATPSSQTSRWFSPRPPDSFQPKSKRRRERSRRGFFMRHMPSAC